MANPRGNEKTVRLTGGPSGKGGIVTGPGQYAKAGDIVKFDRWTANLLITNKLAVAYEKEGK